MQTNASKPRRPAFQITTGDSTNRMNAIVDKSSGLASFPVIVFYQGGTISDRIVVAADATSTTASRTGTMLFRVSFSKLQ